MSTVTSSAPRRVDVFDGLRGIAIVLVVLSHGWTIWPSDYVLSHRPLNTLFASGNFAVSIFFAVGAFVATQGLIRKAQSPMGLHPAVEVLRRYVRLTGQVGFLLVVIVLVTVFDETDPNTDRGTRTSILRVLTYTWNWYLQSDVYDPRADLGHLWYLSVYLQSIVLIAVVVWLLRRRPVWLVVTLAALLVGYEVWTAHVYATEGIYQALLRTSVRIDAPLTGALAAAAVPFLGRFRPYAGRLCAGAVLALVPLAYLTTPNAGYFTWPGHLTDATLFVFVASAVLAPVPRGVAVPLGWSPLVFLGSRSLGLYIWHYPVFFFVSRHHIEWHWGWRAALAVSLTLACVFVSERLVENRVQRAMQSPGWRQLDYGLPAYAGRTWKAWRARRGAPAKDAPPRQHTSA